LREGMRTSQDYDGEGREATGSKSPINNGRFFRISVEVRFGRSFRQPAAMRPVPDISGKSKLFLIRNRQFPICASPRIGCQTQAVGR
jgi:hypothetical protein